ncbi:MAG: hypothetical protein ABI281_04200 [Caldimonas sp.]
MGARAALIAVAGLAYVAFTHWLMTSAPASGWNAALIVGPMLLLATLYTWQRRWRWITALLVAATAGLVFQAWHGGGFAPQTLYLAQHVVIHALLGGVFGATLQSGREPLITTLARRVHGRLSPDMADYSRQVTVAWTAYFFAMAGISIGLYLLAPFDAWAVFANFVTPVAMVALFVGEYVMRYRLHPEFERATLSQAVHAYSQRSARGGPHE